MEPDREHIFVVFSKCIYLVIECCVVLGFQDPGISSKVKVFCSSARKTLEQEIDRNWMCFVQKKVDITNGKLIFSDFLHCSADRVKWVRPVAVTGTKCRLPLRCTLERLFARFPASFCGSTSWTRKHWLMRYSVKCSDSTKVNRITTRHQNHLNTRISKSGKTILLLFWLSSVSVYKPHLMWRMDSSVKFLKEENANIFRK